MREYKYDVFLSFTGADRELKTRIFEYLEANGLTCYDSDTYCNGQFRENYCQALDQSRVYLMILTDNLRRIPDEFGKGTLTEVRRECSLACELEASSQLNMLILCASEFFRFDTPYHDYNDEIGWFFYSATRSYTQIYCGFDEAGAISEKTLTEIASHARTLVEKRNLGKPQLSQAPRIDIAEQRLPSAGSFIGRGEEILAAMNAFSSGAEVVLLSGMGGIGKTALAIEIARQCEEISYLKCPQVVYIQELESSPSGLESVVSSVRYKKAVYDGLSSLTERDRFERKLEALCELPENLLLVIDNFNGIKQADVEALRERLKCKVLITTRSAAIEEGPGISVVPIRSMSLDSAYVMFESICKRDISKEEFSALYASVAGHTITLCIIARMLSDHKMSLSDISKRLGEFSAIDERIEFKHNEYGDSNTVIGHLTNLFKMTSFSEGALDVLRSMSILSTGRISPDELMNALGLTNRNDIIDLVKNGWLELQSGDNENLYLHPILSRLVAQLLKPTIENTSGMINYIKGYITEAKKKLSYADITTLDDMAFYAINILATASGELCTELWEEYAYLSHILSDTENTKSKLLTLSGKLSSSTEVAIVTSYYATLELEAQPSRVDIIEKYLASLDENANDYKWVLRSLSLAIPNVSGNKLGEESITRTLNCALESAMAHDDDYGVMTLASIFIGARRARLLTRRLPAYIRHRKRQKVKNGALISLETILYSLRLYGEKDFYANASQIFSDNMTAKVISLALRHPVLVLKMVLSNSRIKKLDDSDPMKFFFGKVEKISEDFFVESSVDAKDWLDAMLSLYMLQLDNGLTLSGASDAVIAAISSYEAFFSPSVRTTISKSIESADIDMENLSVKSVASLQVSMLLNRLYGNPAAIDQSLKSIAVIKRLRPEGHPDISDAYINHAKICSALGEQSTAYSSYIEAFKMIRKRADDSAKLSEIARALLGMQRSQSFNKASFDLICHYAFIDLDPHEPHFFSVIADMAYRVLDRVKPDESISDNPEYARLLALIDGGISDMAALPLLSQTNLIATLYRIASTLLRAKRTEEAAKFRERISAFKKSKLRSVRDAVKLYHALFDADEAFMTDSYTEYLPKLEAAIDLARAAKTELYYAAVNACRILLALPKHHGYTLTSQVIDELVKNKQVNSRLNYLAEPLALSDLTDAIKLLYTSSYGIQSTLWRRIKSRDEFISYVLLSAIEFALSQGTISLMLDRKEKLVRTLYLYEMTLDDDMLEAIADGEKTIELRLYDEKRRKLRPGDHITFRSKTGDKEITCRITRLVTARGFKALAEMIDIRQTGLGDVGELLLCEAMRKYYTKEDEVAFGTLAIYLELV